jgi:hypothetical protein
MVYGLWFMVYGLYSDQDCDMIAPDEFLHKNIRRRDAAVTVWIPNQADISASMNDGGHMHSCIGVLFIPTTIIRLLPIMQLL